MVETLISGETEGTLWQGLQLCIFFPQQCYVLTTLDCKAFDTFIAEKGEHAGNQDFVIFPISYFYIHKFEPYPTCHIRMFFTLSLLMMTPKSFCGQCRSS